jgi:hypothetical protein
MANNPNDSGAQSRGGSWDISQWLVQELKPTGEPQVQREVAGEAPASGGEAARSAPANPIPQQARRDVVAPERAPAAPVVEPARSDRKPVPEINRNFARAAHESAPPPKPLLVEPEPRTRKAYGLLLLLLVLLAVPALFYVAFENTPPPVAGDASEQRDVRRADSTPPAAAAASTAESENKAAVAPAPGAPAIAAAASPSVAAGTNAIEPVATRGDVLAIKQGMTAVNVRPDPSTRRPPVAKLEAGSQVEKVAADGAWLRVKFTANGAAGEGWIRRDMVE